MKTHQHHRSQWPSQDPRQVNHLDTSQRSLVRTDGGGEASRTGYPTPSGGGSEIGVIGCTCR